MTTISSNIGEYSPTSSFTYGKNNNTFLEYQIKCSHLVLGTSALRLLREKPDFWIPTYYSMIDIMTPRSQPEIPADFEKYSSTDAGDFYLHSHEDVGLWYGSDTAIYVSMMAQFLKGKNGGPPIGTALAGSKTSVDRGLLAVADMSREKMDDFIVRLNGVAVPSSPHHELAGDLFPVALGTAKRTMTA